jgi:DNA polymerase III epsilon subunit-like protein
LKLDEIEKINPKHVIVLDTETTGIGVGDNEILSLSIIDLEGTVLFDELVKPEKRQRWPKAQEVHGITPAMVKDKKHLLDYKDRLHEIWDAAELVVGYNVEFDTNFIYASGLCLTHVEEFDVMREFAPIWGKWDNYHQDWRWAKLTQCAAHYGIKDFDAHSSLGDTEATRQCFLALIKDPEYVSHHRVMEGMRAEHEEQEVVESKSRQKVKRDTLDKVLTVTIVILALAAVGSLFKEWQMSVVYLLMIVAVYFIKQYRTVKKVQKGSLNK